jgi:hypothetical protein
MNETEWSRYGRKSGHHKCTDCMVHCGYEPTAVDATFGSLKGLLAAARITLFGLPRSQVKDDSAISSAPAPTAPPLVTLELEPAEVVAA